VLFCDLRGTAPIGGKVEAPVVLALINAYIGAAHDAVDKHQGLVIEFLGDAVLAVFGTPEEDLDHAEHAVRAAIDLRQRIAALDDEWVKAGAGHVRARIGLHTGPVVAGNMGGNSRMKYAVIGDTVNVASRVENLNDPLNTDILATGATVDRLPADLKAQIESKGDQLVKGRAIAVAVSEIRWRGLTH
jgi:adenylate cyclase